MEIDCSIKMLQALQGSIVWFEITWLKAYIEFVHDLDHGFIN
jgi:hypothetical protein